MELSIYDSDLNLVGIVENFSSLIWVRKFFEAGSFELACPAIPENIRLLKKHMLIEKPDSVEVGYISSIDIKSTAESGAVITVSGVFLSGLLSRRIIFDADEVDDLLTVIDKQIGALCKDSARKMDKLLVDKSVLVASEFNSGQRFYNLAEYAKTVCKKELCGLCVSLVHDEKPYLLLGVKYGTNHSIEQTENPQVVFSPEFDNLLACEYRYSEETAANTVYGYATAADEVIGIRPEYLLGDENTGANRLETVFSVAAKIDTFETCVKIGEDDDGHPVWGYITVRKINQEETLKLLEIESVNKLHEISENMSGDVLFSAEYKSSYDLGDVVTVHDPKWGILLNQRIYEVTEYYENGDFKVNPTFGSPLRTIADFLDTT